MGPRILIAGKCFWEGPWRELEENWPFPRVHRGQAPNIPLCSQGHVPITDPTLLILFLSNEILPIAINIQALLINYVCIRNAEKNGVGCLSRYKKDNLKDQNH